MPSMFLNDIECKCTHLQKKVPFEQVKPVNIHTKTQFILSHKLTLTRMQEDHPEYKSLPIVK